jgi:hypothetical protein
MLTLVQKHEIELPRGTVEITFGLFPCECENEEYLRPEIWAIDSDGEPIKRLALADCLEIAENYAHEIASSYHLPCHLDDYSELA